jgi:hypothetical protein
VADDQGLRGLVPGITAVTCPACGVEVISPSLDTAGILDRHFRHCRWEPEGLNL